MRYLYDHPEGASIDQLWAEFSTKRFQANVLFELFDAGVLTVDRLHDEGSPADPWNFKYRLSYEQWVTMTHAAALADRLLGTSGTE